MSGELSRSEGYSSSLHDVATSMVVADKSSRRTMALTLMSCKCTARGKGTEFSSAATAASSRRSIDVDGFGLVASGTVGI